MSRTFVELNPQNFSFNSPLGWCPACQGLGTERGTNQGALISNPNLSLLDGAVSLWPAPRLSPAFRVVLESLAAAFDIPLEIPWYQLDPQHQRVILYGSGEEWIEVAADSGRAASRFQYKGLYPSIDEASRVSYTHRQQFLDLVGEKPCSVCNGDRMRDDAAAVRLNDQTLPQLCRRPLSEMLDYLKSLKLNKEQKKIAGDLLNEAIHRLSFLVDVGLDYLTLDRSMPTLSGGESQRIRLAGQIGRALTGVLYVLDEPTIGLHPRDNNRLISALHRLRDLGNTVVLVEHDREVLEAADRLYDFGPGAGRYGGSVVAEGAPKELERQDSVSLTGAYLRGTKGIPIPTTRRLVRVAEADTKGTRKKGSKKSTTLFPDESAAAAAETASRSVPDSGPPALYESPPGGTWLELKGARQHNLRGVDLWLPLGTFVAVTGLSGSGKSSLLMETLGRAIARHLHRVGETPGAHDEIRGIEKIDKVIVVDQSPLGSTPASNPATYTGVWDPIRELFARLPEAKVRGYKPGRFSFNRAGGRCEECEGMGQKKIEMHFLPDVWVECATCKGHRFNQETLAVRYRNKSIADVLTMSIGEALELFDNIPKIRAPLATLDAIGLGYLTLGQSAATLSGGEAQRVKLASELCRPNNGKTLYLLDEPTTGLHFDDISKLLKVLNSLVEQGNTVAVIEHNLDVIKTADWVVDMGPEAGVGGGWIVAQGTPEEIVEHAKQVKPSRKNGDAGSGTPLMRSWTGELLAPVLESGERADVEFFDAEAAAKKRAGDIDIAKVGKDSATPWQSNGRQWHTADRISHSGRPARWEGTALAHVIDQLAEYDELAAPNWNHRSIVEVMATEKSGGWFLHAQTGDEWLLTLKFRVKKSSFDEETLKRRLALKPLDDLDELPVYGRGDRVRVKNLKGPWQEVTVTVHWLREIETPAFADFLKKAVAAFLPQARVGSVNPAELMPWTVLGKKWHLSRKGFPSNKRVDWEAETLESLFGLLEKTAPKAAIDWTGKTTVTYTLPGNEKPWAEVVTKRRNGIDLVLYGPAGRFALGRIAELGAERDITAARDGRQAISLRLVEKGEVGAPALADFLREHSRS